MKVKVSRRVDNDYKNFLGLIETISTRDDQSEGETLDKIDTSVIRMFDMLTQV